MSDLREGRHSFDPGKHPRDGDGQFARTAGGGNGASGSAGTSGAGGRHSGGTAASGSKSVKVAGGQAHITRRSDGSGTISAGSGKLDLSARDYDVVGQELEFLTLVPHGATRTSKAFTVGSSRDIPYKGGPNDTGGKPIASVTRTGRDTFTLHLGGDDVAITARDAGSLSSAMASFERDRAQAAKAARDAEIADRRRSGAVNPADAARRKAGKPPADDPDRGMPSSIDRREVSTADGPVSLHKTPGDRSLHLTANGRSHALTEDEIDGINSTITSADDGWEDGDSERVTDDNGYTYATVTKVGNRYAVSVDGQPPFTLTPKEADRLTKTSHDMGRAVRIDTDAGPFDLVPDGSKLTVRHLGDDGRPMETVLTKGSARKLQRAINVVHEGFDDEDDGDDEGVTRKDISTNVGPVRVELKGGPMGSPGSRLHIGPADGDEWGIVVDGENQGALQDAISDILEESARPLTERVPLTEAAPGKGGRRFRARLIAGDIQGSSGYYPAKMLRECAHVFREGLPVFLDHPSVNESYDRPERSVRDLAGKLATPAVYERDGLYADVEVYPHWAPVVEAMWPDIGMSIRASGTVEASQREGVRGPIVTALTEAASVDFVTAAGAGGKVVALLESARAQSGDLLRKATEMRAFSESPRGGEILSWTEERDLMRRSTEEQVAEAANVGNWLESRIHSMFTQLADDMFGDGRLTRDERISLSNAIGEGLSAFNAVVAEEVPHLYQRDLWREPEVAPAEVSEAPAPDVPAPPVTTLKEGAPVSGGTNQGTPNGGPIELSEAELRTSLAETKQKLAEAELEIAKLGDQSRQLAEAKTKLAEAERTNLRLIANNTARDKAVETLAESTLPEVAHAKVIESVTGANVPLNEDGALDEAKLVTNIKAAIEAERAYLTRFAEAAGIGRVRGLGDTDQHGLSEAAFNAGLKDVFTTLGLPEAVADLAVKGR